MTPTPDDRGRRELVPDAFRDLDDTLADGPSPADVPAEAKAWLASQRFVHGVLRAMHTADAAAREGRIERLLQRVDRERAGGPRNRREWAVVAAAAALLAAVVLWFSLPARLPTAEAAVDRIVGEMARDVDRRYRVDVRVLDARGETRVHHEFSLVARPGRKFRLDGKLPFGGRKAGELRAGSDGVEMWMQSANGLFRQAAPIAERERFLAMFGDALDVGFFDVNDFVERLPGAYEVRVTGRSRDAGGRAVLELAAVLRDGEAPRRFTMRLRCDEATGMVLHLEAERWGPFGRASRRLEVDFLGEEPAGLVDYRRPW